MNQIREGIRVAIDLRRNVEPETIKRQLYKFTSSREVHLDLTH